MKKTLILFLLLLTVAAGVAQDKPAANDKLPLHLGIVLRASKTTFNWEQAAATELVKQLIQPGDEAFVITAGGDRSWPYERLEWDSNPESLIKFIKGLDKNSGMPEAFKFELQSASTSESREYLTKYVSAPPETSAFAIVAAMMKSDSQPARRVAIMFRDPWDHSPGWESAYAQSVERRHDMVISILKDAGVSVFIVGIEDVSTRPQLTSDIASSYVSTQSNGAGGNLRVIDQEVRKEIDFMTSSGRTNMERISKETGGEVVYSTKKNYSDAVPAVAAKVSGPAPVAMGK